MKTTFKKSVLAFLTCVLALAFALTGCSGGGKDPKANFVGSWQYSGGTLDGEELTDEYMDMLEEWGVNCILILDEDGTGTLDLFLEVVDLKWEAKDATTATVTAEDESHDLKLKDDKLVLEVDGDKFPALGIAYECLERGGTAPCTMNAANEVAVAAFLQGRIGYSDIVRLIERALERADFLPSPTVEDYTACDREVRGMVSAML